MTSVEKEFESKGGKKPFFPPITYGLTVPGLVLFAMGAAVGLSGPGQVAKAVGTFAAVSFVIVLSLSVWAELQFKKYGVKTN